MKSNEPDDNLLAFLQGNLDDKAGSDASLSPDAGQPELRMVLDLLATDKGDPPPPEDLALRTLGRVAQFCCRDQAAAPLPASRDMAVRSRWRPADFVVAASLLLMMIGLGLPALHGLLDSRQAAARVECQEKLRVLNVALHTYEELNHKFPSVVSERPRDAAGMVIPILASAGVLQEAASIRCPGSDASASQSISLEQARAMPPADFFREAPYLAPSYAYSLGYRDEDNNYFGPSIPDGQQAGIVPLLADAPPVDNSPGNSGNHGGAGQNVLFADGHVQFFILRNVGFQKDDIYLNKANLVAAGLDPCDTVLGASAAKP